MHEMLLSELTFAKCHRNKLKSKKVSPWSKSTQAKIAFRRSTGNGFDFI